MKLFEVAGEYQQRLKQLSVPEFIKLLETSCARSIHQINRMPIYRGMKYATALYTGDTGIGAPRKSKNTDNYYTLWVDNSREWEKYPKRSRSFICTTSAENVADYGKIFLAIPYDDSKVGIAPASDYWYSFSNYSDGLDSLVDMINALFKLFLRLELTDVDKLSGDNYDTLKQFCTHVTGERLREATALINSDVDGFYQHDTHGKNSILSNVNSAFKLVAEYGSDFSDVMDGILTSDEFAIQTGATFSGAEFDKECFIGGKALFVSLEIAGDEKDQLGEYFSRSGLDTLKTLMGQ